MVPSQVWRTARASMCYSRKVQTLPPTPTPTPPSQDVYLTKGQEIHRLVEGLAVYCPVLAISFVSWCFILLTYSGVEAAPLLGWEACMLLAVPRVTAAGGPMCSNTILSALSFEPVGKAVLSCHLTSHSTQRLQGSRKP